MEFNNENVNPDRVFTQIGPLAYDDQHVLVLEGAYVTGQFSRKNLERAWIETRTSFKHPFVGLIFATIFLLMPVSVFVGDPLGIRGLLFGSVEQAFASGCFALFRCEHARFHG